MSDHDPSGPVPEAPPPPEPSRWAGVPWVWAVPIVALLIAGWLGYRAFMERGPTITITFATADGLEADRTTIRYKNVELGRVTGIALTPDRSHVVATAAMLRDAEPMLRADTKFWVVQPRITPSGVSGLTTIVSGTYIGMLPGKGPPGARSFTALDSAPPKDGITDGQYYTLVAERLPSITNQSPVYYHGVQVGEVNGYELSDRNGSVAIHIFVYSPHETLIRTATRFWPSSGLQLDIGAQGVKIGTESWLTLIAGGIVFDTPKKALTGPPSKPGSTFHLYPDQEAAEEAAEEPRVSYRLFFPDSLRGVRVGTPVELRGITVGHVADVRLEYDPRTATVRVPVTIDIDPERIVIPTGMGHQDPVEETRQIFYRLVAEGLRARIGSDNLLLGQRVIELDFVPDAPGAQIIQADASSQLPTTGGGDMQELASSARKLLDKAAQLPLADLVKDIRSLVAHADNLVASPEAMHSLQELDQTLGNTERLTRDIRAQAGPLLASLKSSLDHLRSTIAILGDNPRSSNDLLHTLTEMKDAARSVRVLADYIERHPEALLRGKPQDAAQ